MNIQKQLKRIERGISRRVHALLHEDAPAKRPDGLVSSWPLKTRVRVAMDVFERSQGYRFDIKNPRLFPEKINWYKLFYEKDGLERIVDKYLFKSYILDKLGDGWTIPLIGVWDNIDSLQRDWDTLPNELCLKSTIQGGGEAVLPIQDRSAISFSDLKETLAGWLEPKNTFLNSYCRAYYKATPRILAEVYKAEIGDQLYDYKVFCFDGEPYCCYVATDHYPGQLSHISFYDLDWNRIDARYGKHPNCDVEKPREFDEMIRVSKILSEGFPFVRVDFFETADKLYVAELTFYPGGGLTPIYPKEFSLELGNKFVLPR